MAAAQRRSSKPGSPAWLRIVGGDLRGQRIRYSGDPRIRPMKDRVRESLFNLLAGTVHDRHAVDLFAGTGALGIEAISRGAAGATLLERHPPTAHLVRENVQRLGLSDRAEVQVADAFRWAAQPEFWPAGPWVTFCCPPYRYYHDRAAEMDQLLTTLLHRGPADSTVVVEAPADFDPRQLPDAAQWEVRTYPPALLAILYATGASP